MYIQEKAYQVYTSEKGELLFVLLEKEGDEDKPMIVYDGGQHAVLYRNKDMTVLLDYLNEKIREPLAKVTHVLVAEFKSDGKTFVREYECPVKQVKKIPLPAEGIMTPEDAEEELKKLLNKQSSTPKTAL
ncbi:MAG: hypothetical protein FWF01_03445 [Alphaproteobacteria bacterium]|nr:hypothetical protein [Alphaproteobacteria bacterium]